MRAAVPAIAQVHYVYSILTHKVKHVAGHGCIYTHEAEPMSVPALPQGCRWAVQCDLSETLTVCECSRCVPCWLHRSSHAHVITLCNRKAAALWARCSCGQGCRLTEAARPADPNAPSVHVYVLQLYLRLPACWNRNFAGGTLRHAWSPCSSRCRDGDAGWNAR